MKLYLILFCLVFATGTATVYECHHWTKEDRAVFGLTPTPAQERERCEDDLGFIFTQGVNDDFPGAGGCLCIKANAEKTVYECHHWTKEDRAIFGLTPSPAQERERCEDDLGFIFTQGVNDDFPGAGGCLCIKPKSEKKQLVKLSVNLQSNLAYK